MEEKLFKVKNTKVNILGTIYSIIFKKYEEDPDFKLRSAYGFCNMMTKTISICILDTIPDQTITDVVYISNLYKEILRHEIVHAFLYESGLDSSSHSCDYGWATDEEIVDWIAIQSPKLVSIYNKLNLL